MKPKKKKGFDVKDFFVKHTEKIIVALLIPAACYIGYQGTLYEPLKWQPDELRRIADEADKHIKESVRKAVDEEVSIRPYDTVATWIKVGVKPDLYRTEIQWMPPLFPEKIKRAGLEPAQLFAIKDLKAYTGLGAIAVNPQSDAAQAANITTPQIGQRWTVLTGLIPVKEQLDVYVNLYSSSVQPDPARDFPIYRFYEVERAQIEPGQTAEQLKWEEIDFTEDYVKNVQLWGTTALDPVDPTYIAPSQFPMAYPLPPVEKKYGEEVAHPPLIPLLTDTQVKTNKEIEKYREKMLKNMFKVDARDILEADPFGVGGGMRGEAGMNRGGTLPGGTGTPRKRRGQEEEEDFKPVEVSNYLFRFFDFSVEPGKTYKYRVRLVLANPNFRMPPNVLVDESTARDLNLKTDFCTPTNAVTVPLESRVLVTSVASVADNRSWEDPSASILAVHFDLSDGSEWCVSKDKITRGSTVNYPKQKGENYVLANKPKSGTAGDGMNETMSEGTQPRGKRPQEKPKPSATGDESKKDIDVVSDVCVLDVLGGQRLQFVGGNVDNKTQELRSPGKMIVLEPSGNLVIHNVSTDLLEVNTVKNPVAVNRSGMYGEGMSGGSMSSRP